MLALNVYGQTNVSVAGTDTAAYSKSHLKFTELSFQGDVSTEKSRYTQHHIQVTVDTRVELTRTSNISPIQTPFGDKETLETTGSKTGRGFTGSVAAGFSNLVPPFTSLTISGKASGTTETSSTSTVKKYSSRITRSVGRGRVSWGFSVDDPYEREAGLELEQSSLPRVDFLFLGGDKSTPPPLPPTHYIEIASCWSMTETQDESGMPSWLNFWGSRNISPYQNICQVLALEIPADLEEWSPYMAAQDIVGGPPCDEVTSRLMLTGEQQVQLQGSLKVISGVVGSGNSGAAGISAITGE